MTAAADRRLARVQAGIDRSAHIRIGRLRAAEERTFQRYADTEPRGCARQRWQRALARYAAASRRTNHLGHHRMRTRRVLRPPPPARQAAVTTSSRGRPQAGSEASGSLSVCARGRVVPAGCAADCPP